jgi:dimethylglycine dehydrogenase
MVRDNNAVMGDSWGLETPLWFAPKGTEPKDVVSFHRSNDFEHIGAEVRATRERVGVTEIANFAKYEVAGTGAEDFLNRLMTNRMPKTGRIVLTPMLNEFGKLIGDFTIAKADDDRFMIWGSSAAQKYHMRWFEKHLPKDGSVRIHRYDQTLVGLSIAGPKSQALLQKLVDEDVSSKAFRFMDFRQMAVAGAPCMVNRITYTGDLGYEIWMQPAYQRLVYLAIKEAGEEFGIVDFGMRALLSMRLEKNFPP